MLFGWDKGLGWGDDVVEKCLFVVEMYWCFAIVKMGKKCDLSWLCDVAWNYMGVEGVFCVQFWRNKKAAYF